ncbi:MAG: hypothetical protein M1829_001665 [Trizodia sp. TS-e1964]|nr:MAG: hypothetical protein M1829_001665 [Trizodia sp. TS-e1964]
MFTNPSIAAPGDRSIEEPDGSRSPRPTTLDRPTIPDLADSRKERGAALMDARKANELFAILRRRKWSFYQILDLVERSESGLEDGKRSDIVLDAITRNKRIMTAIFAEPKPRDPNLRSDRRRRLAALNALHWGGARAAPRGREPRPQVAGLGKDGLAEIAVSGRSPRAVTAYDSFELAIGVKGQRVDDNTFHDLQELIPHSFQAGICALFVKEVNPWYRQDPSDLTKPFEQVELRNNKLFLQHAQTYLILRYSIKHGDVGLLKYAVDRLTIYFHGSKQHKYAYQMLYLQRFLRGKPNTWFETDRLVEFHNGIMKQLFKARHHWQLLLEDLFNRFSLTSVPLTRLVSGHGAQASGELDCRDAQSNSTVTGSQSDGSRWFKAGLRLNIESEHGRELCGLRGIGYRSRGPE